MDFISWCVPCGEPVRLDKQILPPDGRSTAQALDPFVGLGLTGAEATEWWIEGPALGATIDPETGLITAGFDEGVITIVATFATCSQRALLELRANKGIQPPDEEDSDCDECVGESCGFGSASINIYRGIDIRFPLGHNADGDDLGHIWLWSDDMDEADEPCNCVLSFNLDHPDVRAIWTCEHELRQVMTPAGIVDIIKPGDPDEHGYDLYFTPGAWFGAEPSVEEDPDVVCSPLIYPTSLAQATVIWDLRHDGDRFIVRKKDSESQELARYEFEALAGVPAILKSYDGEQLLQTIAHGWSDSPASVSYTYLDPEENPIRSIVQQGFNSRWTQRRLDPDGANLTWTRDYYWGGVPDEWKGQLKYQTNPDGTWTYYTYDAQGRLEIKLASWKDAAMGNPPNPSNVRRWEYDYTPLDPADSDAGASTATEPRTIVELIEDQEVARTYHVYFRDPQGPLTLVAEQCTVPEAQYGASTNLRSEITSSNKTRKHVIGPRVYPDGREDTYTFANGQLIAGVYPEAPEFVAGSGTYRQTTITHGTESSPAGVAFRTMQDRIVKDKAGRVVLEETWIFDGTEYHRVSWTLHERDDFGHATTVRSSDGTIRESAWGCCARETDIDESGVETQYVHDPLGRITRSIRIGVPESGGFAEQADLATGYDFDELGQLLQTRIDPDGVNIATLSFYDDAGRITSQVDEIGLTTQYVYDMSTNGGRVVSVIQPGGPYQTTSHYADGRVASVTGSATVARYYDYDANTDGDGSQYSIVRVGASDSPRYSKTTYDMLGRVAAEERPAFGGGTLVSLRQYGAGDATPQQKRGRLIRSTPPSGASTLYEYDATGELVRSGLDLDGNGTLDLGSADRISEFDTRYVQQGDDWWRVTDTYVYAVLNDDERTRVSTQRQRLTGLGYDDPQERGIVTRETESNDIHGNVTISRAIIDRDNKLVYEVVDVPASNADIVSVTRNGLLQSSTTATGVTTTYQYDALGRRTGVTDPRTGTVTTHYDPDTHRVDYVEDASTNRTSYAYDEDTGRLASVTNALGNKTYYLYNARGQVTHTWGDVPQPVVYGYDDYGQRTTLTTFRDDGVDWTADEWPSEPPEGDTTTWTYDEATGLVTAKRYADDKGPDYDYTADGRLSQRTWARQVGWPAEPLTTDYAYDPATGELTGIDYSDATPDVSFMYARTGAPATVIDVVGTRTFAYNDALQLVSESMGGASPMHTKVITRTYENGSGGTLAGRYNGVQVGTSNNPSADYSSTYYYDSRGRLSSLNGPATPMNRVNYVYLANSELVHKIEYVGPVLDTGPIFVASVIRSFEPNRDLMTSVENKWNDTTVSKFEYTNDALGRRTSVTVSGTAFTAAGTTGFDLYAYNDRNELASAKRYTGGTLEDPTNPVYARHFIYDYDPIGNRESYQIGQGTATTYTANELNQYTATADPSESFTNDDDGNLTQDGTYTYVWDAENRLIEAYPTNPSVGSNKCVMDYDYMNRRVRRTLYVWNGSSWTAVFNGARIFVYDGWNTLVQYNPQSGAAMGKYTWGLDLSGQNGSAAPSPTGRGVGGEGIPGMHGAGGIGGLLCAWRGGTSTREYFCLYDANGNLSDCVKNSDGTLWTHVEYDPYGGQIVASDPGGLSHQFRFSTKFYQSAFGNYDFGYRILEPRHGRWISRDPVGLLAGLNNRGFVYNSPPNLIDPVGLWDEDVHRGLTIELARRAGICCPELIGAAANLPDEDYRKAGVSCGLKIAACWLFGGALIGPRLALAEARLVQEWHFPLSPTGRVDPGSPAAKAKINAARLTCDLQAFGEGLHTFQDSWSHQGVPPYLGLIGHSRGAVRINVTLGPPDSDVDIPYYRPLTGWAALFSTSADDRNVYQASYRAMANAVYDELVKFKKACPCACPNTKPGPPEWRVIPTDGLGPRTAVLVPGPPNPPFTATSCGEHENPDDVAAWLLREYPRNDPFP